MKKNIKILIYIFCMFFLIFSSEIVAIMAYPGSTPQLVGYSDFELCTSPSSVFTGGCCAGAGQSPTLNWKMENFDTLCDANGSPMTTVPSYKGIITQTAMPAEDNICGCPGGCIQDYSYQVSYWLQIDNNSDFSSPELDTGEVFSGVKSYTVTPGDIPDGTYYWRVGISDQYGTVSAWAKEDLPFSIPLDCSVPTPNSPVNPGASILINGSNHSVCSESTDQPPSEGCYDGNFPVVRMNWSFTPALSIWSNGDGLPLSTPPSFKGEETHTAASIDDPYLSQVSQAGYWLEVDDSSDFSSPVYKTGYVESPDQYHQICFDVLDFNTTYYWRVAVKDSRGSIGSDAFGSVWAFNAAHSFTTVDKCAPDAPTDLAIRYTPQPLACSSVKVEWTDNSQNEDGFLVEISEDGLTNWSTACDVNQNINSCNVSMIPQSIRYFRVKAYVSSGASSDWEPISGGVEGSPYPFCAPEIDIPSSDCDCVNITWTVLGDESRIDHYKLERRINDGEWELVDGNIPQGTLTYEDCDIIQSSIIFYEYMITAYEDAGETIPAESEIIELTSDCQKLPQWIESR